MEVNVHIHRNGLAHFNAIAPLSGERNRTAVIISRSKDVLDVQHGTGLIRLIAKLPTKENLAGVSLRSTGDNKVLLKSKTVWRLISRRRARHTVHVVLHAVCNRLSGDVEVLYDCIGIAYFVLTVPTGIEARAIKGNPRYLITRQSLNSEVERTVRSLNGFLVRSGTSHATRIRNAHSVFVKVGHHFMMTRAHEIDEGKVNVFLCSGHRNCISVFRGYILPPAANTPYTIMPNSIFDIRQSHDNGHAIIEHSCRLVAHIICARNGNRLVVDLKRIQKPVIRSDSVRTANRAETERQIVPNTNTGLIGNSIGPHHAVSIS